MIEHRRCWSILLLIGVIGCQSQKPAAPETPKVDAAATNPNLVDVTLALNWYPEAEHGGFYAALVHGLYEEEGLRVTIRPGGPGVPVIADVAAGKVEFAVDNADKLLLLRAQQADVVAVMSPIQNSPRCVMVHKSAGLTKLADLAGKKELTLAINQGQPFAQYMIKKLNLGDVRIVPFSGGVATFLEDPNFGQQAYSFSEPFTAETRGSDPRCLMVSEIGFNPYTSALITSGEIIEKKSDLVAKMNRASIRGWKRYLADPDKTNFHILVQNPEMGLDILGFGARSLKPICLPEGLEENRFGEMTADRWEALVSQMVDIGQIKPDSVKASEVFSLKFIDGQ